MNTTLKNAIARSISHNEIVQVDYDGDSGNLLLDVRQVWDGEIDYTMIDREGEDRMDVWGWDDSTPAHEHAWRLDIRFKHTTGTFWGSDWGTYFVAESGRIWLIQSVDYGSGLPKEVDKLPAGLEELDPRICFDLDLSGVE